MLNKIKVVENTINKSNHLKGAIWGIKGCWDVPTILAWHTNVTLTNPFTRSNCDITIGGLRDHYLLSDI